MQKKQLTFDAFALNFIFAKNKKSNKKTYLCRVTINKNMYEKRF